MPVDELLGIAQKRTVEVDVLTCGQLEIETCAKLDEGGDVSANNNLALGGLQNTSDDFKQVDLPEPLVPIRPTTSPLGTLKEIWFECTELFEE